jgi:hypothetical protein
MSADSARSGDSSMCVDTANWVRDSVAHRVARCYWNYWMTSGITSPDTHVLQPLAQYKGLYLASIVAHHSRSEKHTNFK